MRVWIIKFEDRPVEAWADGSSGKIFEALLDAGVEADDIVTNTSDSIYTTGESDGYLVANLVEVWGG